jgi:putative flavoprotein involved in K+ transport
MDRFDCIIVGAGPAGIGVGIALQDMGLTHFVILERSEVGASFLLWPEEMRFITPSFTSNAYGLLDLNAIALSTSPAYTLGTEHPSGADYADYLQAVADYKKLPIQTGIDVEAVRTEDGGFVVDTSDGPLHSRFVIWAAGEFQYPRLDGFPGAEHCIHNSLVDEWKQIDAEEIVIIGGYESGIDAAIHLSRLNKKVKVIDRSNRWERKGSSDPSVELTPYTKDRLKEANAGGLIEFMGGYEVHWVEPTEEGGFILYCENEAGEHQFVTTEHPPLLATGFNGSLSLIGPLFERGKQGEVRLNANDESTLTPGLFVVGPGVVHDNLLLCFIYKFRQRFAIVAKAIAATLGLDASIIEEYRKQGMLLEDLSCCGEDCQC